MMELMLAKLDSFQEEIRTNREEMLAKMETNQQKMDAKMGTSLREMKTEIRANNEKFEVIQGTLISWMVIHQARTESIQEEMKAKMDIHQEKMEAAIHSIQSELEETSNIGWNTSCLVSTKRCRAGN
jgi:hypothetical protein